MLAVNTAGYALTPSFANISRCPKIARIIESNSMPLAAARPSWNQHDFSADLGFRELERLERLVQRQSMGDEPSEARLVGDHEIDHVPPGLARGPVGAANLVTHPHEARATAEAEKQTFELG
ncbi:hypothetical protein ACTJLD_14960 [Burkholderia sp. 22088]|uniref:hypothetical protein n=1 Tax=Burkholderia sp. 22088 TaxID=3453871 RepID=UPI003F833A92